MKKGLIDFFRFYSTGIGIIYLIYVIFGHQYKHAFAAYHYGILILYFSAVIWLIASLKTFLTKRKTSYLKTVIFLNTLVLTSFTLWMYLLISK